MTRAVDNIRIKKHSWDSMTIPELKSELEMYKIKAQGRKEDLIRTLKNYFEPNDTFDLRKLGKKRLRVLMVAEKPQMAKELAKYLAPGGRYYDMKEDGVIALQYHDEFKGHIAEFIVSSTFGHVYSQDFDNDRTHPKDSHKLFDEKVVNKITDDGHSVVSGLKRLAEDIDVLVLWLDCDLEGEAICYEVIEIVKNVMNQPPTNNIMDVIFRAKFSAAEDAPKAIQSLGKPNFRENLANYAKHDLDLKIGVAFSRLQTSLLRKRFRNTKDVPHISFGPCQTPCLTFCVDRYRTIENHKSNTKYYIVMNVDFNGQVLEIKSDPIKNYDEAIALYNKLSVSWFSKNIFYDYHIIDFDISKYCFN